MKKFPTNIPREQWLAERSTYLGGSDVGIIYGLSTMTSNVEFYYQKVGVIQKKDDETIHSFMGKIVEDTIAMLWQYYNGDTDSIIANYNAKTPIRKSRKTNYRYTNPKYPHLSVNLDRVFNDPTHGKSVLECKSMLGWVQNRWEAGIPPQYVMQVQTYMGVLELPYAEMAIMVDNRFPEVYPFEFNPTLFEQIADKTADFWDRVLKGREAIKGIDPNSDEVYPILDEFCPEPIYTEVYEQFLKKKYRSTTEDTIIADEELLAIAKETIELTDQSKDLAAKLSTTKSKIMEFMGEYEVLDCQNYGRVTWRPNAKGTRVLRTAGLKYEEV